MGGTREVHLFSQNDDSVQVAHFYVGEHSSNPLEVPADLVFWTVFPYISEGTGGLKKVSRRKI
jgi:hypothetical protein